jgi:DNA-binding transcriptional LysR family regulator
MVVLADEISDLRLLVNLVAAGSLSEAARRGQSSPPVMSRRLAAMERRLGVRLVARSSRRFALTEEGSLLHQRAVRIIADIDAAEAEAAGPAALPRGTLRVGAPMQIGRRLIAPLIGRFAERFPEIQTQLVLSDVFQDLVEEELDVALTVGPPLDPDLLMRRLLVSRRVICAAPDYLARYGVPLCPEDLLQHNCIRKVRGRRVVNTWHFSEAGGERDLRVSGNLSTNSGEVMHEWLLRGRGIGVKALWDIEEDLAQGRLIECLADYSNDRLELCASFVGRPYLLSRTRVFVDFIAAALEPKTRSRAPLSSVDRRREPRQASREVGDQILRVLEPDMQA